MVESLKVFSRMAILTMGLTLGMMEECIKEVS
jgi:hypothetical protein